MYLLMKCTFNVLIMTVNENIKCKLHLQIAICECDSWFEILNRPLMGANKTPKSLNVLSKKCLKVRQKLGTRENFENLKIWKFLKIWNFLKIWKFEILNSLSWSSGHAEQLLFSCLCSKVTVYGRKLQCVFFWHPQPQPVSLEFLELVPS